MLCDVYNREQKNWNLYQNKIWNYFLQNKKGQFRSNIIERFTDTTGNIDVQSAKDNLRWFIEQRLELPYNENSFRIFDKNLINRIGVEIDAYDKALGGKFSNLAWVVPEGISKQDPTSRRFYNELNEILNFERVNVNKISSKNGEIAELMASAYLNENVNGTYGKKIGTTAIDKVKELRKKLVENPENISVMNDFVSSMETFINNDKDGITIKQFHELISLKNKDFDRVQQPNYVDPNEFLNDKILIIYKKLLIILMFIKQ